MNKTDREAIVGTIIQSTMMAALVLSLLMTLLTALHLAFTLQSLWPPLACGGAYIVAALFAVHYARDLHNRVEMKVMKDESQNTAQEQEE